MILKLSIFKANIVQTAVHDTVHTLYMYVHVQFTIGKSTRVGPDLKFYYNTFYTAPENV